MKLLGVIPLGALIVYAVLLLLVRRSPHRARRMYLGYLWASLIRSLGDVLLAGASTPAMTVTGFKLSLAGGLLMPLAFYRFVMVFLDQDADPHHRRNLGVGYVAALVLMLIIAFDMTIGDVATFYNQPVSQLSPVLPALFMAETLLAALSVTALARGRRQAKDPTAHNLLAYLLAAASITWLGNASNLIPGIWDYPLDVIANLVNALVATLAILRYRLLNIAFVARRILVYFSISIMVSGGFVASFVVIDYLYNSMLRSLTYLVPAIVGLLVAATFPSLRDATGVWIDRLLFHDRYDARRILQQISGATTSLIDLDSLGATILGHLVRTMGIERAALFVRTSGTADFSLIAHEGWADLPPTTGLDRDHPLIERLHKALQVITLPELIQDVGTSSLTNMKVADLSQMGLEVFIPAVAHGQLVGVFALGAKRSRDAYWPEDQSILMTLAHQTAIGIANAALYREIQHRVEELRALRQAFLDLAAQLDLNSLLDVIVRRSVELLRCQGAVVYLADPSQSTLCVAAEYRTSRSIKGLSVRIGEGLVGAVAETGEPVISDDLRPWPRQVASGEDLFSAMIAVPLRSRGRIVGVLGAGDEATARRFGRDDLRLFTLFAGQIAIALENAWLFDETRQRSIENAQLLEAERAARQVAETLQDLARLLGSRRDLQQLLELVLERLENVVTFDHAILFLLEEDELCITAERGVPDHERHWQSRFPVNADSFIGEVLQRSEPTTLVDMRKGLESLECYGMPGIEWTRSWIGAPLCAQGEVLGLLTVAHRQPGFYQPRDVQVMSALAGQVAVAVQNSRLYRGLREERERYRVLFERAESQVAFLHRILAIGDQMRIALDLPQVLTQICEGIRDILGWNTVVLCLEDGLTNWPDTVAEVGNATQLRERVRLYTEKNGNTPWYVQAGLRISHSYLLDSLLRMDAVDHNPELPRRVNGSQDRAWSATDILVIPIDAAGKRLGTIWVDDPTNSWYPDLDEVQALEIFANQAAVAIENARLFRELELLYHETAEAHRRVETVLAEAAAGLMVLDSELRVSAVNPGAQALFGRTASTMLGYSIMNLTGDSLWGPGSPLQRAIDSGARVAPQAVTLETLNDLRDVLVGVTPIPDGYLLSFADVTQLKEVDRLKTEFVANVSHELRTPLASIKAYAELLLNDLDEGDAALRQHFLSVIDHETDRLAILVSDLLDLSRLESGRVVINKLLIDLRDVIRDVVHSIEIQAKERDISLKVMLPDNLPTIMADPEMMKMILKNLLSNAIKFSSPNTCITISCQGVDNYIEMRVCDQGIGIPEDAMPHLFEKFYRVQSTTESGIQGSGLGLALVQEAVASHGGWVNVQSQVGKGSCFTVALPVTPAAELTSAMQTRHPHDSNQGEWDNGGSRHEVEITDY